LKFIVALPSILLPNARHLRTAASADPLEGDIFDQLSLFRT
jgi:hypothetical protein